MTAPSPTPDWPVWLADTDVPADEKTARLAEFVSAHGALPAGCESLWTELKQLAPEGRLADALLPRLCRQLPPEVLAAWLRSTSAEQIRSFLAPLIYLCSTDPSLTQALSATVRALDDDQLSSVVQHLGALGSLYPKDEPLIGQRVLLWLQKLPQHPDRFLQQMAAIRAGARWLPKGDDRVRAWRQFQDAFERFVGACQQKARPAEREQAAQQLVADLWQAMPEDWYADDRAGSLKRQLLSGLIAATKLPADALPENFEQKAAYYSQTGRWPHEASEIERAAELEEVFRANAVSKQILCLTPNVDHAAWTGSPAQKAFVGKAVRQKLAGPADAAFLDRVLQSQEYLPLMLQIAVQGEGDEDCTPAVAYLVERIALDRLDKLLGPGDAARGFKLHALRHHVAKHNQLPGDCDWFWTERPARGKLPLAFDVFRSSCVTPQLIKSELDRVPDAGLNLLFRSVLRASIDVAEKREILARIARRPAFDVVSLAPYLQSKISAQGPLLKAVLMVPIRQALNRLHAQPERFSESLAGLEAALPLLADEPAQARVQGWLDLKRILEAAQYEKQHRAGAGITSEQRWAFTDQVCRCLNQCFDEFDEDCEELRSTKFGEIKPAVQQLARDYGVGDLLTGTFNRYLWAVPASTGAQVLDVRGTGRGRRVRAGGVRGETAARDARASGRTSGGGPRRRPAAVAPVARREKTARQRFRRFEAGPCRYPPRA